jgi:outer membrane protein
MIRFYALTLVAGLIVCAQRPACAQVLQEQVLEQQGLVQQPRPSGWGVTLGAGVGVAPEYPGASSYHAGAVPLAELTYGRTLFIGTEGLGVNLINSNGFRAGVVLGRLGSRSERDDPRLTNLGNIPPSLTAGVFASYLTGPFMFSTTVRQAFTQTDNGLLGLVQFDYLLPLMGHKMLIAFGPDLEFSNARYNQTWFGVTPAQSLDSGLPVFNPGAGVRDVGVHASLTYRYSQHFLLRVFGNLSDITGDDGNSPIVENRAQALFGVGLAYHF